MVQSLFEAQAERKICGVHGRLGSLGQIDKMYDVAISKIGGTKLDYVVVENIETAE